MKEQNWRENWPKNKERLAALWENEVIDRACIAIPVNTREDGYETITTMSRNLSKEELKQSYTDPEYMTREFRKKYRSTLYMGDALPCVFPNFGTNGFIQYVGSKPNYQPDTIWCSQVLSGPDASTLEFDENIYREHIDIVKKLVELSHDDYFISMPDHCGILDGLSILRGNEDFILDLVDEPEFIQDGVNRLIEVQKRVIPGFYDAIRKNNDNGITHAWMHLWSPVPMMQLQCDESVMFSPAYYKKYVLQELERSCEWCDNAVYHLDGQEQVRHLDHILSVKQIKMIQWTPVAGQPPASDFIPVLQRI